MGGGPSSFPAPEVNSTCSTTADALARDCYGYGVCRLNKKANYDVCVCESRDPLSHCELTHYDLLAGRGLWFPAVRHDTPHLVDFLLDLTLRAFRGRSYRNCGEFQNCAPLALSPPLRCSWL